MKFKNRSKVFYSLLFFSILYPLSSILYSSNSYADKIYLKSGKVCEGKLIGKSERRYLFALEAGGSSVQVSFFPEDVEKIELSKDTVEEQIPYLKDVESLKVGVDNKSSDSVELSLYKGNPGKRQESGFTGSQIKKALNKEEAEYYQKFNDVLEKYVDKLQAIQNTYLNLTTATKDDFASAKQYMDELYFELNNIFAPEAFKKSHILYLQSVKATYLAFHALEQGMLDEASKQIKISEDTKQQSMEEFRNVVMQRQAAAVAAQKENTPSHDASLPPEETQQGQKIP